MGRKKKKFWDYAGAALYFLPDVAKQTLLPDWLHDQFKKTVIKSIVKLIICIFAVYVAIFKSIGGTIFAMDVLTFVYWNDAVVNC